MQDMTTTIAGGVALGFPALKVIIRILAKATSRLLGLSKLEMGLVPGWSVLSFVYMWIHHFRDHPHYPAAPVIDVRVEANQEYLKTLHKSVGISQGIKQHYWYKAPGMCFLFPKGHRQSRLQIRQALSQLRTAP